MHIVWHLVVLLHFITFRNLTCKARGGTQRLIRDNLTGGEWNEWRCFRTSEALPLREKQQRERSSAACFSCMLLLSVGQSLQIVSHSLQWGLMVSWPTGEECQLSPQLHTKAKSRSWHWDQRSLMMWLDPTQSMDTRSWPLASMRLMGYSNWTNVKEKGSERH